MHEKNIYFWIYISIYFLNYIYSTLSREHINRCNNNTWFIEANESDCNAEHITVHRYAVKISSHVDLKGKHKQTNKQMHRILTYNSNRFLHSWCSRWARATARPVADRPGSESVWPSMTHAKTGGILSGESDYSPTNWICDIAKVLISCGECLNPNRAPNIIKPPCCMQVPPLL